MSSKRKGSFGSTRDGPVTVEAEYTPPEGHEVVVRQWTFERTPPQTAKDIVLRNRIPLDAQIAYVGVWHGYPEDRPHGGHKAGILEAEGGSPPGEQATFSQFTD